jgi:hypothetical protein
VGGLLFKHKKMTVNTLGQSVFNDGKNERLVRNQKRKYSFNKCFIFNFKNTAPKDLIVMYDIPKEMKKEREWFLRHLKRFDYSLIQRGVWVGPSPLPKDFLNYVKSIGLLNKLRTLKLAKPYSVGDRDM